MRQSVSNGSFATSSSRYIEESCEKVCANAGNPSPAISSAAACHTGMLSCSLNPQSSLSKFCFCGQVSFSGSNKNTTPTAKTDSIVWNKIAGEYTIPTPKAAAAHAVTLAILPKLRNAPEKIPRRHNIPICAASPLTRESIIPLMLPAIAPAPGPNLYPKKSALKSSTTCITKYVVCPLLNTTKSIPPIIKKIRPSRPIPIFFTWLFCHLSRPSTCFRPPFLKTQLFISCSFYHSLVFLKCLSKRRCDKKKCRFAFPRYGTSFTLKYDLVFMDQA